MSACPKTNPNYPNTASLVERPFSAIVRKAEPDFDKERRFDRAYDYGRRVFKEDALLHGAYTPIDLTAEQGFVIYGEGGARIGIDGATLVQIAEQFRRDNGFCDPADDGTVTTGTGAEGRNPGSVPSITALKTESGLLFKTEDGRTFLAQDPLQSVGVVFKGA